MRRLALAGSIWLGACAGASTASETSTDEAERLRAENAALRAENAELRASTEPSAPEAPAIAEDETPEALAALPPLRAECTAIVSLAGLSVRYGERHPRVLAARTALLEASARLESDRAAGRAPDVGGARSALAIMLAEERMSPAGRGEVGPSHPDAQAWRARSNALTALITELESQGTCTAPE